MTINFDRLKDHINTLAQIGRQEDGGIYRMAFTPKEQEARKWLSAQLKSARIPSHLDGALNMIGRLEDTNNQEQPAILIGSHIDTVPNAGALDGALGVLVGLECLTRIKEENIQTSVPLELIAFSDEEGRFGGMFGSRALSGQLNPGIIEEATDLDGQALKEVVKALGYDPYQALDASRPSEQIKYYLELHIEQGPVLDVEELSVGIVTDITGLFKWQVQLTGAANHAGTTPMELRKDAFMGLADFAHEIPRILDENGSEASRVTIGNAALYPGSANTVPGKVEFSIDARDVNIEVLEEIKTACRKTLSAIARRRGLQFDFNEVSVIEPVACDAVIKKSIEANAKKLAYGYKLMPSGAAHDAQMMAKIAPIGMIFVPSKNGVSHSPHEWTDWHHIEQGANLMLNTILDLSK
ncbi:N-carbamoyl-L-amino-acid hydrolase [Reichenbachiella faecimaris]|uniref:N-carbamoyl-L-amino-acid hydrolase n=1 Tax=Reichenbachiella faecimaris TaxID=692418 RepID=A0A1W2G5V9_REIFA|nr:Zn-dependent hydrolase [Reichenbachiella faecimaris]SMD31832.1 N-carbamoyl-L-amino-acid hydrolase [Reichenbachiella faecimaris]